VKFILECLEEYLERKIGQYDFYEESQIKEFEMQEFISHITAHNDAKELVLSGLVH
jgi:hypothetical protein